MSAEGLDDKMKMKLVMEIMKLIKNPALIQAPVIPEKAQAEVKIRQNNDIMAVITDFITKKGISYLEFVSVLELPYQLLS